jgi:hypothetical protein
LYNTLITSALLVHVDRARKKIEEEEEEEVICLLNCYKI